MASDIQDVIKQRGKEYGDYRQNFTDIAALWTAYLAHQVTPHDVAMLMVLLKIARAKKSPLQKKAYCPDTYLDIGGYSEIARSIDSTESIEEERRSYAAGSGTVRQQEQAAREVLRREPTQDRQAGENQDARRTCPNCLRGSCYEHPIER